MNEQISLNVALRNPPAVKMLSPTEMQRRLSGFSKMVLSRNDLIATAYSETFSWCDSTKAVFEEVFGINETEYSMLYVSPCFSATMLCPENYQYEGGGVSEVMASTGYMLSLPSDRFAELITNPNNELEEPLIGVFTGASGDLLRGCRWAMMNLFWRPHARKVLCSVSFFWNLENYLMQSEVALDIDNMSPDNGTWDCANLRSSVSGFSRERLVKQDILRAIDLFDAYARHEKHDQKIELPLRKRVEATLAKNHATDVAEWFKTARFPLSAKSAAKLHDIVDLTPEDKELLEVMMLCRDEGQISCNETIFLPQDFFATYQAELTPDSKSVCWGEEELHAIEGAASEANWLSCLSDREEVDQDCVRGLMESILPAVRILSTDRDAWDELVHMTKRFARKLRVQSD